VQTELKTELKKNDVFPLAAENTSTNTNLMKKNVTEDAQCKICSNLHEEDADHVMSGC